MKLTQEQIQKWLDDAPDFNTHVYIAEKAYFQGRIDALNEISLKLFGENIK
jgi:hypothetical protein